MNTEIIQLFIPATIAFLLGIFLTPILTHYLYKNEMWKKKAGKVAWDGKATPLFNELHKHKEVGTPKMGGIIIWLSVFITISLFWIFATIFPFETPQNFDFLSRSQTWIPLATLLIGAFVGLLDDYLDIKGSRDHISGGLSLKKRLLMVGSIALICAIWFYYKLEITSIGLPLGGEIPLGIFFIPFFILVIISLYTGGVIDGIDGLAGGVFASMFAAYGGIAYYLNELDLAAFCAVVVGAILSFLWFNIPPARFYMSETGSMSLTITLGIVAFMTDRIAEGYGVLVLPVIAFPLLITTLSNIIQILSKKFRGKKVFLIAPLHHHFEALGWSAAKVTMRYWILGVVFAVLGLLIAMVG